MILKLVLIVLHQFCSLRYPSTMLVPRKLRANEGYSVTVRPEPSKVSSANV